jgi:thiamine biosynthesis lipoprotein
MIGFLPWFAQLNKKGYLTRWFFSVLFMVLALTACDKKPAQVTLTGDTMGSTYHVTLVDWPKTVERDRIHIAIERIFDQINLDMSTYSESSVISKFNRLPPGELFAVSDDLLSVIRQAQAVSEASGGAYDITVSPLVDVWGFGANHASADAPPQLEPPSPEAIAKALAETGFRYLQLQENPPALQKKRWLMLNLNSIAPGFAADKIAAMLEAQGIHRYLVDVGGELRMAGSNAEGKPWTIGIEDPRGVVPGMVRQAVQLTNGALATSGNYHHFMESNGVHYSHIIDPRTGMAVSTNLVSVTVIDTSAAAADAWATAYSVLGVEATLALSEQRQQAVYLLVRDGDTLSVKMNSFMQKLLERAQ